MILKKGFKSVIDVLLLVYLLLIYLEQNPYMFILYRYIAFVS